MIAIWLGLGAYNSEEWSKDRMMEEIKSSGVPCYSGSCSEAYLEKAFDNSGLQPEASLPMARELDEASLMFLAYSSLTKNEVQKTCDTITSVMLEATK